MVSGSCMCGGSGEECDAVLSLLVTMLILVLILAIAYWIVMMIPLPDPVRWVVLAIVGIIAILVLVSLLPGGTIHVPVR